MVEPRRQIPSYPFSCLPFHINARCNALVRSHKYCLRRAPLWPTKCNNPRVQDEVISQQVGDWEDPRSGTAGVEKSPAHTSIRRHHWCFPPSLQAHQAPACAPKNPAATPRDRNHTISHMTYRVCFLQIRSAKSKCSQPSSLVSEDLTKPVELHREFYLSAIHELMITTAKHAVVKSMQQYWKRGNQLH